MKRMLAIGGTVLALLCGPVGAATLAEALNATNLTWITGGDAPWFIQTTNTFDGTLAAQSGHVVNNRDSWLETVAGPGLVSFWWATSSEFGCDFLEFSVNGVVLFMISGEEHAWSLQTQALSAPTNILRWRYFKDDSDREGADAAWLVQVSAPSCLGPPQILVQPVSRTNHAGTTATFSVLPAGSPPLHFQWRRDSVDLENVGAITGADQSTLTMGQVSMNDAGAYSVVVTNASGSITSAVAVLTVPDHATYAAALGRALNATNLDWTTGGDALWVAQSATAHDGEGAAQSGPVLDEQESWLETKVTGPGRLAFWWKVSSEADYDFLEFSLDGNRISSMSGASDWEALNFVVAEGVHTLRWRYSKDDESAGGADCGWLDEVTFTPWPSNGPAILLVWPESPSPAAPYAGWASAAHTIQEAVDAARAGDVVLVTNGLYATGGRAMAGSMTNRVVVDKAILVQSVHGSEVTAIGGASAPGGSFGDGAIRGVHLGAGATLIGFTVTNGFTRMAGDLVLEQSGGGVWCESTNAVLMDCRLAGNTARQRGGGVYRGRLHRCELAGNYASYYGGGAQGAVLTACVLRDNDVYRSDSGGGGADQCSLDQCSLFNNSAESGGGASRSMLTHCRLWDNSATEEGGGVWGGTLVSCLLESNGSAGSGGGAEGSTLENCLLRYNSAQGAWGGGGAWGGLLRNCTVIYNSAPTAGGGVFAGVVVNSILYFNSAPTNANYASSEYYSPMSLRYCCTTPRPVAGTGFTNCVGNITNDPGFISPFPYPRLQADSPCINAGLNREAISASDLDGLPRILGGAVDLGAYEFQSPASTLSYAWLQQYGLPCDGSADFTDPDGDRLNNWQEWRCGTDPTNALSVLRLFPPDPAGSGVTLTWPSAVGRSYALECSTNLGASPAFFPLATNLPGQPGTTTFTDTNAIGPLPRFYRVGVSTP
jgi:hypothetical protein